MNKCKHCGLDIPIINKYSKRKQFCNHTCSAIYSNSRRPPPSEEHRRKVSEGLKRRYASNNPPKVLSPDEQSKAVGRSTKFKYKGLEINSIWECSSRTIAKIIKRMDIGCSRCGWKESSCDIHHIKGRKIDDPHNHTNLILLCPNCHRLAHVEKIDLSEYNTIYDLFGETWKDYYYG